MQQTLKPIKRENDSYLEDPDLLIQNNCEPENDDQNFYNNNEFLFGIINNTNIKLSPESNISDLFSQSSTNVNEDFNTQLRNPNLFVPRTHNNISDGNLNIIGSSSNNIIYPTINPSSQGIQFVPTIVSQGNNITLPLLQTYNNSGIQYINRNNIHYVIPSNVKPNIVNPSLQNIVNSQMSTNTFLGNTQAFDSIETHSVDSIKVNKNSVIPDEHYKKLEYKREKNREAARKCRDKKTHLIGSLELRLNEQKSQILKLQEKMKLVLDEMRRLNAFIALNIPGSHFKDVNDFIEENEIGQCLNEKNW